MGFKEIHLFLSTIGIAVTGVVTSLYLTLSVFF